MAAEVHLYETLPGTQLGHLAAFELEAESRAGGPATGEFEELSTEAAALLVGQPQLGRHPVTGRVAPRPGTRLYRVAVSGVPLQRRHRRFVVRLDATGPKPVLRVHLRLSERDAHELSDTLARRTPVQVIAALRRSIDQLARHSLAGRLVDHTRRAFGTPLSAVQAGALANVVGERMIAAVAADFPRLAPIVAAAVRDPAAGVTFTFAFTFADRAAVAQGAAAAPTVTVRPGWHRD